MSWLRELSWKLLGYPDLPPRNFRLRRVYNQFNGAEYMPRWQHLAFNWLNGMEVEEIADRCNLTRTRVRSCIWKAYWHGRRNEDT